MWEPFCLFLLAWSGLALLGRLVVFRTSLVPGVRRLPVSPSNHSTTLRRGR